MFIFNERAFNENTRLSRTFILQENSFNGNNPLKKALICREYPFNENIHLNEHTPLKEDTHITNFNLKWSLV